MPDFKMDIKNLTLIAKVCLAFAIYDVQLPDISITIFKNLFYLDVDCNESGPSTEILNDIVFKKVRITL